MTQVASPTSGEASCWQEKVAASTGSTFSGKPAYVGAACFGIEMLAAGTLGYINRYGDTVTHTALPAGYRCIEAQAILNTTTVAVLCYF